MRATVLLAATAATAATACTAPASPRAAAPSGPAAVSAAPAPTGSDRPHVTRIGPETLRPRATPRPPSNPWTESQRDGRPGWGTGYGGCGNATALPARGTAPFPDATLRLELPSSLRGGRSYTAHAVITNTGDRYLHLDVQYAGALQAVLLDAAGHGSEQTSSDAIVTSSLDVAPGHEARLDVVVVTSSCGDGLSDPEPPLPAGTYRVGFALRWSGPAADASPSPSPAPGYRSGAWGIVPSTVRVG
jgi:hypothetical protein